MRVYIAGPYASNPELNVRNALLIANQVMSLGYYPYVPHLTHYWHLFSPKPFNTWIELDLQFLRICDCVLRLPGESKGADIECREAGYWKIPVYHSIDELPRLR